MNLTDIEEIARQERNHYNREYRKAHPERVREYNARYWARRAAKRKEAEENAENSSSE